MKRQTNKRYASSLIKLLFSLISVFSLFGASSVSDAEKILKEVEGCFVLYDIKTGKTVERYGAEQCTERFPPCSTFKVALALMGFDSGILADEQTTYLWDGKPKMLKVWEQNIDARTWMKESVVWYSQELARRLGRESMAKYLREFDYGNADMSGGLETAWLSPEPSPTSLVQSSIAISADEQAAFFSKLWRGDLKVNKKALDLTRQITYLETSPKGYILHGKTGSGYASKNTRKRLGWFIGYLKTGSQEYVGVVRFTDKEDPEPGAGYGGPQAREFFKEVASSLGYW
jgi:beta-lactamase class D